MLPDTWLKDFVTFELETLWRRRQKHAEPASKNFRDPLLQVANRQAKKKNGGQGYIICCEIAKQHRNRTLVYPVEFLDRSDIISASFSDTQVRINGKFSIRAEAFFSKSGTGDIKTISPGAWLCLNNFELHFTSLGDKDWNVSLLINEFYLIRTEKSAVFHDIPLVKFGTVESTFRKLLSSDVTDASETVKRSSIRRNDPRKCDTPIKSRDHSIEPETRNAKVNKIDSDIASQDGGLDNSPSSSSQIGLSTQAQPLNIDVSSGVNLAAPQEPRRKGLVESGAGTAANASNRTEQLLALIKGHKNAQATKEVAGCYVTDASETHIGDVIGTQFPQATDRASKESLKAVENWKTDTVTPALSRTKSPATSHTAQTDYPPAHQNDFKFVQRVQSLCNGPDREQHELLRRPGSWNYPDPGHKFPGLNIPIDILNHLTSRKPPEANLDTEMNEEDNSNIIGGVSLNNEPGATHTDHFEANGSLNASPESTPLPWSDSPQQERSPQQEPKMELETESILTSSSPLVLEPSSPETGAPTGAGEEPRDSSLEPDDKDLDTNLNRSNKRVGSPSTPSRFGVKRIRFSSSPVVETSSAMARRAKREFVLSRRRLKEEHLKNEHSSLEISRQKEVDQNREESLSGRDGSSMKESSSLSVTHPLSKQPVVLQIRSPEVPRTKSPKDDNHKILLSGAPSHDADGPQAPTADFANQSPTKLVSLIPASSLIQGTEGHGTSSGPSMNQNESFRAQSMSPVISIDSQKMPNVDTFETNSTQPSISNNKGRSSISPGGLTTTKQVSQNDTKFIIKRESPSKRRNDRLYKNSADPDSYTQFTVKSISTNSSALVEGPQSQHEAQNEWWRTEDTTFKRFFRDYASLKVFDGVLGIPTTSGPQVLATTEKHIDVLSWRI